jgi:hypothetical protein
MNALPESIVEQLWDEVEHESEEDCPSVETCMVEEEEFVGMNRAEDMTEETRNALDQARREVMESMKKQKEQDGANS